MRVSTRHPVNFCGNQAFGGCDRTYQYDRSLDTKAEVVLTEIEKQEPTSMPLVPFSPELGKLIRTVQSIAARSDKIQISIHACQRMVERDITDQMMIEVLRSGYISGNVEPGVKEGEWKFKIVKRLKGRREVGIAIVLRPGGLIFVKTVEWEDVR